MPAGPVSPTPRLYLAGAEGALGGGSLLAHVGVPPLLLGFKAQCQAGTWVHTLTMRCGPGRGSTLGWHPVPQLILEDISSSPSCAVCQGHARDSAVPPLHPQGWVQHGNPSCSVCPSGEQAGTEQASLLQTALPVPGVLPAAPPRSSGSCFTLHPPSWQSGEAYKGDAAVYGLALLPLGAPKPFAPGSLSRGNSNCSGSLKYKKQDLASPGPAGSLQVMGWGGLYRLGHASILLQQVCQAGGFPHAWGGFGVRQLLILAKGPGCLWPELGLCREQLYSVSRRISELPWPL